MVKSTKIKARTVRAGNKSNISTRKTLTKLNNKAILETATTTPSNKELKRNNLVRVRNCIVRIKRLKLNARDPTTYDVNKTLTAAQSKDGNKENRDDAHAGSYSLQSGSLQGMGKEPENADRRNFKLIVTDKKNVDRRTNSLSNCQSTQHSDFSIKHCRVRILRFANKQLENPPPVQLADAGKKHLSDEPLRNCTQHQDFSIKPCRVRLRRCSTVQDIAKKQLENLPPARFADVGKKHLGNKPARNCPQHQGTVTVASQERILRDANIQDTRQNGKEKLNMPQRMPRFFHRDQPPARTRSSVTRQVYDFLSQTQIEDDEKPDPAADIIKNMIEDGRACAMTRSKTGKTRARAVRKKVRPVGKRKQCSVRNIGGKDPIIAHESEQPHLSPICEEQNNLRLDIAPGQVETPVQLPPTTAVAHKTFVEGAYSPLARSLMLNQTKAQQFTDRRLELLHMAKKCISTPLNGRSNTALDATTTIFSPVLGNSDTRQMSPLLSAATPSGVSSPWRVPDETPLPNTFEFGLNTSQLPSYSSDFIRKRHVYLPGDPECSVPIEQDISSVGNDSDRENVPPSAAATETSTGPQSLTTIEPVDNNENVTNLVQLPNPRRALKYRSPLKDINILDVVVLPSWKKNVQQKNNTPTKESLSSNQQQEFNSNIPGQQTSKNPTKESQTRYEQQELNSYSPEHQCARDKQEQQRQGCDLFGFEDFLSEEDEICVREPNQSVTKSCTDTTLHEKLQRLKNLRPAQQELPQVSQAPMRHAYDDLNAREPRQRNIKDMLCSTMIGKESTNESIALFKDIEPETTFDEKKPRRTYVVEKPKRKRKQRVRVLFIDSDSSENEDEANEHGSKNNSDELPKRAMPPQKRTRRDAEHEAKLQQFITSFNQECSEVEKFPLIIE
ncbi:protein dalmatian isoform X1 [Drosophila mojavensis]|uniref:Uncharacterized protein, isoform A n=1 Tax=Drosophila mojavensis TaxID=7230 RepID=B4KCW1_DROMO|nr:protein dalmatian isoform X1 [Drosophila mojavensis]EDW16983.2 uncharacterized protein Dmoj_GI10842, isoform A [Drosophila mojavensis]